MRSATMAVVLVVVVVVRVVVVATVKLFLATTTTTTMSRRHDHHHHHHHYAVLVVSAWSTTSTSTTTRRSYYDNQHHHHYYYYFAIGSNLMPSTMTCWRNLSPTSATAAILPNYRLSFDIGSSSSTSSFLPLESSAASVQSSPGAVVHGVLYELTGADFRSLSLSEGVPWVYQWQPCQVIPYQGDGRKAGETALQEWHHHHQQQQDGGALQQSQRVGGKRSGPDSKSVGAVRRPAMVLVKSRLSRPQTPGWPFSLLKGNTNTTKTTTTTATTDQKDIPPSPSYLSILQRGARLWQFDEDYQTGLGHIPTSSSIAGVSGLVLAVAELCNPRPDLDLLPPPPRY